MPAVVLGQSHPDLSGEWNYDDHIIPLKGGREHAPLSTLIIKQTGDRISLEAKAFQQEQPPVTYRLDGQASTTTTKEGTTTGSASWEGATLVIQGTHSYETPAGEMKWEFKEIYSLANGVLTVDRTEIRGGRPSNDKFAFSKQPYKQAAMPPNTPTKPGPDGACPRDALLFKACAMELAKTYKAPRTPEGEPDLSGYWQMAGGMTGTAPAQGIEAQPPNPLWNAGRSMVIDPADGTVPYQAWAKEDREWRMKGENAPLDTLVSACLSGYPRTELYSQSQWIRTKDQFVIFYEFHHQYRFIKMNGQPPLEASLGGLWAGSSRGHWEGDTLVVETTQQNGKEYVDMQFVPLSDAARIVERYTRIGDKLMYWEATINDPKVYTRPWTINGAFRRNADPDYEILESACAEDNREFSANGVYRSFDFARLKREAEERARARAGQ
ncbi:MAG: hypothetical protein M3N41_13340 [Acidobacteriota bacterium]|nr:hypothetical protein [Acidobacteriota bacterium]